MNDAQIMLDAQLLVLLAVGKTATSLIEKHKNTRQYDVDDFDLLRIPLDRQNVLLLPNVVTEASNLIRQHRRPERTKIALSLADLVNAGDEMHVSSRLACADIDYLPLGLTDAALILGSKRSTLLSADLNLCIHAEMRGISTINFNHERERYGLV